MTLEEILETLEQEKAAFLDPLDIPGDWTQRQRNTYETQRSRIDGRIRTIRAASHTLSEVEPRIAAETEWLAELQPWRKQLCDELLALPAATTSRELGTQQNLKLSISAIDRGLGVLTGSGYALETLRLGTLMREAGYKAGPPIEGQLFGHLPWFGSVDEIEHRLKNLTHLRDDARARLDGALRNDSERRVEVTS